MINDILLWEFCDDVIINFALESVIIKYFNMIKIKSIVDFSDKAIMKPFFPSHNSQRWELKNNILALYNIYQGFLFGFNTNKIFNKQINISIRPWTKIVKWRK